MSSHHIVRENQEPALVVADFNALDSVHLGQLLEWSPTVITDSVNLDFFISEGIKVDIVFGDKPDEIMQESTKFMGVDDPHDFIRQALSYLITNQFKAVNILTESVSSDLSSYAEEINIVLFCQGRRYAFVRGQFEKWKPKGEKIYIDESCLKSFQGLDYTAKGEFITTSDGFITVEFSTHDFVLIGEEI